VASNARRAAPAFTFAAAKETVRIRPSTRLWSRGPASFLAVAVLSFLTALPFARAQAASVGETYVARCAQCHAGGEGGAPRAADAAEWGRRIRAGMNLLHRSAIEGMPNTAMAAKGGHRDLDDAMVRAIVDFMVAQAGLPADALKAAARYDAFGISNRDFVRLDTDYDGLLSRAEAAGDPGLAANLDRFDANRDGRLSVAEYETLETTLARERTAVQVDDATLAAGVRAALAGVKGIPASVKVDVSAGVVTMAAVVEDAETARRAETAIKRIAGIRRIDNRLVSGSLLSFD